MFGHPRHIELCPCCISHVMVALLHRWLNDVLTSAPWRRETDENHVPNPDSTLIVMKEDHTIAKKARTLSRAHKKACNSSDSQARPVFPSWSPCWISAAVFLLRICLESRDCTHCNPGSYVWGINGIWIFKEFGAPNNRPYTYFLRILPVSRKR
jgi:hypothetical protein